MTALLLLLSNFLSQMMALFLLLSSFLSQNDGPAHFKQLSVPTTAPQAFSATTATTTMIKTSVPMTIAATTKAILLKLDNCFLHPAKKVANYATPRCLLLLPVSNRTAITMTNPSLLLPFYQNKSAIMMATHANLLLLSV
jgi:hypothetical protein